MAYSIVSSCASLAVARGGGGGRGWSSGRTSERYFNVYQDEFGNPRFYSRTTPKVYTLAKKFRPPPPPPLPRPPPFFFSPFLPFLRFFVFPFVLFSQTALYLRWKKLSIKLENEESTGGGGGDDGGGGSGGRGGFLTRARDYDNDGDNDDGSRRKCRRKISK